MFPFEEGFNTESIVEHWDLPSLGIQNTKVVYLRHMDSHSQTRPVVRHRLERGAATLGFS